MSFVATFGVLVMHLLRCTELLLWHAALLAWQLLETSSACSCPSTPEGAICKCSAWQPEQVPCIDCQYATDMFISSVSRVSSTLEASHAACAGSGVGRIVQAASADAAAGTQDGVLSFQEGRDTLHVSFGAAQVRPAPAVCRVLMLGRRVTLCRPPGVAAMPWRLCCHVAHKVEHLSSRSCVYTAAQVRLGLPALLVSQGTTAVAKRICMCEH